MIHANQRPMYFTDAQVQQLKATKRTLRELNRTAAGQLLRIEKCYLTSKQFGEAGEILETVAIRMTSTLRFRRERIAAARQRHIDLVVTRISSICDDCDAKREPAVQDHEETWREALQLELAHETEIPSLLELTIRIEELMSTRSALRGVHLNAFFRRISRFKLAVLQQQRDFQATALREETESTVKTADKNPDGLDICDRCQKPIEGTNWEAEDPKPIGEIRYGY
jgi:hypothetical protein